jgi:hypothetical protein
VLALTGTFLLSLFVGLLAALQFADHFRATDELLPVLAGIAVFAGVAMAVLAIVSATARRAGALAVSAAALIVIAMAIGGLIAFADRLSGQVWSPGGPELFASLGFAVPSALAVLIQWGLVRRRFLQARADEELSVWPWFATAVCGFAALNPLGLEIAASLAARSPGIVLQTPTGQAAAAAVVCGLALALSEWLVRRHLLRRRLSQSTQPAE